jgi:anti-sigma B factor antagonist
MSRQDDTSQPDLLRVELHRTVSDTILVLRGEFELTGTDTFWTHISQALAASPQSITIDASGLEFMDSLGLQALMRARDAATEPGVAFRISEASPAFRRVVELAGVEGLLPDYGQSGALLLLWPPPTSTPPPTCRARPEPPSFIQSFCQSSHRKEWTEWVGRNGSAAGQGCDLHIPSILGIVALDAGGEGKTTRTATARQEPARSETMRPAPSQATTTEAPDVVATTTEAPGTVATTTTEAPAAVDTSTVVADDGDPDGNPEAGIGSTEACRADPACPSSEHRTGDLCGATLVADQGGYLEGRHDAEQGLPYRIDGAPAPSPEDDDDDDGTVGPQTAYRAGYVQGWCDGGGEPASH